MAEQSNAELIEEVNEKLASHQWTSDWGIEMLAERLAERLLEAAAQKVAEYAAVVEKVRGFCADLHSGTCQDVLDILAAIPADALREVKADVWDEGFRASGLSLPTNPPQRLSNPYRKEQS